MAGLHYAGFMYRSFTCIRGSDGYWHWAWLGWAYRSRNLEGFKKWTDRLIATRMPLECFTVPAMWRQKEDDEWDSDTGISRVRV